LIRALHAGEPFARRNFGRRVYLTIRWPNDGDGHRKPVLRKRKKKRAPYEKGGDRLEPGPENYIANGLKWRGARGAKPWWNCSNVATTKQQEPGFNFFPWNQADLRQNNVTKLDLRAQN